MDAIRREIIRCNEHAHRLMTRKEAIEIRIEILEQQIEEERARLAAVNISIIDNQETLASRLPGSGIAPVELAAEETAEMIHRIDHVGFGSRHNQMAPASSPNAQRHDSRGELQSGSQCGSSDDDQAPASQQGSAQTNEELDGGIMVNGTSETGRWTDDELDPFQDQDENIDDGSDDAYTTRRLSMSTRSLPADGIQSEERTHGSNRRFSMPSISWRGFENSSASSERSRRAG